jgi:hypothetical protein
VREHGLEERFVRRRDGGLKVIGDLDRQRGLSRGHQAFLLPVEQRTEDLVLVVEALVQHRFAHAGLGSDGRHRGPAVPLVIPDGQRRVEDERPADGGAEVSGSSGRTSSRLGA